MVFYIHQVQDSYLFYVLYILQNLHEDVEAHKPVYEDILKSQDLNSPDQKTVDEITKRWDSIMAEVTERLSILNVVVEAAVKYPEVFEKVETLLSFLEQTIEKIKDVSSDPDVLGEQDQIAKVYLLLEIFWLMSRILPCVAYFLTQNIIEK